MLLWAGLPLGIAIVIFVAACKHWHKKVAGGATFSYAGDTFRNPINAAITVSGFFIPLLCGGIGYLIEKSIPSRQLIPLLAAVILFSVSVLLGLWNLFSMTLFTGDKVEIKKDGVWGFVPQFATQLSIMFGGLIVVLFYFLFVFDLKASETKSSDASASVMIARPALRAGIGPGDVTKAWGPPGQITNTNDTAVWHYSSDNSEFLITVRSNSVWSIEERRK